MKIRQKEQLINELIELRQRVVELEQSETQQKRGEEEFCNRGGSAKKPVGGGKRNEANC